MSSVVQNSSHPSLSYADSMATSTSDIILLIGRVLLGWIFLRSGYGKIFDIPAYAATFPGRGLPTFLAYIAVPAEFFGGIALILGLATRYVVIVMIVFMLVATRLSSCRETRCRNLISAFAWKMTLARTSTPSHLHYFRPRRDSLRTKGNVLHDLCGITNLTVAPCE